MNATLPRTRLEWMLAAIIGLVFCAFVCASGVILLAGFGVIRAPAWVFWLNQRGYVTGAGIALAVGLYLMFRQALRN